MWGGDKNSIPRPWDTLSDPELECSEQGQREAEWEAAWDFLGRLSMDATLWRKWSLGEGHPTPSSMRFSLLLSYSLSTGLRVRLGAFLLCVVWKEILKGNS